jgi:hypothetical protein
VPHKNPTADAISSYVLLRILVYDWATGVTSGYLILDIHCSISLASDRIMPHWLEGKPRREVVLQPDGVRLAKLEDVLLATER